MINRNSRCRSGSPAMRRHSRCNQRSLGNLRNQPNQLNLHGSRNPAKRKVAAADKAVTTTPNANTPIPRRQASPAPAKAIGILRASPNRTKQRNATGATCSSGGSGKAAWSVPKTGISAVCAQVSPIGWAGVPPWCAPSSSSLPSSAVSACSMDWDHPRVCGEQPTKAA